ncbi:MAG TPA: histidine kinase [Solirubrobacteraceae bacterium]
MNRQLPPRADLAMVVLALVIGGPDLGASWPRHEPWAGVLAAVAGTLACLSLLARRTRPVPVALLTVTVAAFCPMAGAAAILAIANAGVSCRPRTYVLLAGWLLALVALDGALVLEHTADASRRLYPLLPVLLALPIGVVARMQGISQEADERLRVEQARAAERAQIAREMHDVLAHRISMVSLHAGALEFHPDAPPEDISRAAGVIRASAHAALGELREVISLLRGPTDRGVNGHSSAPQPTLMDISQLVEESREAGMRVSYALRLDQPEAVPTVTGRTVYRIVQEGLTNARKHAPGSDVAVTISGEEAGEIVVSVLTGPAASRDDAAAAPPPGSGTGLIGLAERVELARGRLHHGPTADGGYGLRATLPPPA